MRVQTKQLAVALTAAVFLVGCGDGATDEVATDTPSTEQADKSDEDDAATADDDAASQDDATASDSGALLSFRGEQIVAGPDTGQSWICVGMEADAVQLMFLDEAGNDVSISWSDGGTTNATLTLADGTTWNQADGGVVNGTEQDGTYRLSIQMTDVDNGDTESLDVRITCS